MACANRVRAALGELDRLLAIADQFASGRKGSPEAAVRSLRESLAGEDWPPTVRAHAAGTGGLFRWLEGAARTDEARAAVVDAQTACSDLEWWKPRLELEIAARDLRHGGPKIRGRRPGPLDALRRIVDRETELRVIDLAMELIEEPPPAAPTPRRDSYDIVWQGASTRVESRTEHEDGRIVETMAADEDAAAAAGAIVAGFPIRDDEPALFVWTYESVAAIVDGATFRAHWQSLVECGFETDALIFPADASWLVCYFHHDWLSLSRRKRLFAHRIVLPLASEPSEQR